MRKPKRVQVNVRLSDDGKALLDRLQIHYAEKLGLPILSQAELIEIVLRNMAKTEGLTPTGERRRRKGD